MLNKLTVRNFKRFHEVEIELADPVIFIGPNNSGKTSALQALALWGAGLRHWNEKRKDKKTPEKRSGVTINRRDLVSVPVPNAKLLWRGLHVRDVRRNDDGKQTTQNVRIDIIVEGVAETRDKIWQCGLEFDYANEESFYCRPLRLSEDKNGNRMPVPEEAAEIQIAFLPPMSGLAANEIRLERGTVNVRVGEGRTAEVLRNLCYNLYEDREEGWEKLKSQIQSLFGASLNEPKYIPERGEIEMSYLEKGTELDLSCSGRGLQQTLLLLSYMYANPSSILLLDEPDAHLEILRQRQIYDYLTRVARENGNQIIAASHSEVLLNEAADRDAVVAFVGKPHLMGGRSSQVLKSLSDIGFEDYYKAEQTGWVLYVEGASDLAILQAFAEQMEHTAACEVLERPFVHYIGNNQPANVSKHFHGIREAFPKLKGIAIFDRLANTPTDLGAECLIWKKREIENYLCYPETLEAYARTSADSASAGELFIQGETGRHLRAMRESIEEIKTALQTLDKGSPWSDDTKVSDDFLDPLFRAYFKRLGSYNVMAKKNFHELARFVPLDKFDEEIKQKLDAIVRIAESAEPIEELP